MEQLPQRDGPAAVDLANHRRQRNLDVVEELLAELAAAVDLPDAVDLDARLGDLQQEHREPAVLGYLPVRAGQAKRVVGRVSGRAPDLRPAEDEHIPVPRRARRRACQIRPARGLGQKLDQDLIAADGRREVLALLLLAAHVEDRGTADRERRRIEQDRHLVPRDLLVERPLMSRCKPQPAVLPRVADAGETARMQPGLQPAGMQPRGLAAAARTSARPLARRVRDRGEVAGDPPPGALPETLHALQTAAGAGNHRSPLRRRAGQRPGADAATAPPR